MWKYYERNHKRSDFSQYWIFFVDYFDYIYNFGDMDQIEVYLE